MSNVIEFNYGSFLVDSSNQKWTFSQALKSIIPTFGTVWNASVHDKTPLKERLRLEALNVLSTHINDESNIIHIPLPIVCCKLISNRKRYLGQVEQESPTN